MFYYCINALLIQIGDVMKWTEKFSVGNEKIDRQHQKLFSTLEDHLNACKERKGKEELINTLTFLAKYVVIHFSDEEKHMADIGYPELESHKEIHAAFVKEVTNIINEVNTEGVKLTTIIEVNKKLNDWVVNHIMDTDMKYKTYN